MKFYVFDDLESAIAAEAEISAMLGYPSIPVNAANGQPVTGAVTERWAEPMQRADGKWVFPEAPVALPGFPLEEYDGSWFG